MKHDVSIQPEEDYEGREYEVTRERRGNGCDELDRRGDAEDESCEAGMQQVLPLFPSFAEKTESGGGGSSFGFGPNRTGLNPVGRESPSFH